MPTLNFNTTDVTTYFNNASASDLRSFVYDITNSSLYSALNSRFVVATMYNDIINARPVASANDALWCAALNQMADTLDLANPNPPSVTVTRDLDISIGDNNGGTLDPTSWWVEIGGDIKRSPGGWITSLHIRFFNKP